MLRLLLTMTVLICVARADRIQDYHQWHEACLKADSTKVIDSYIQRYQERVDANPKDHLARVYLGSAYTLRSAESFWGPKKLEYLKKGGTLMDEAVAAAPKDPRVRFLRGVNAYKVPKHFDRRPVAVEDFSFLLPIAEKGGRGLTIRERQAMLYYAALTFAEEGDSTHAERARESCRKLDPDSWFAKQFGA